MSHHWKDSIALFFVNLIALLLALGLLYAMHRWIWTHYRPLSPEPIETLLRGRLGLF